MGLTSLEPIIILFSIILQSIDIAKNIPTFKKPNFLGKNIIKLFTNKYSSKH